MKEEEILGILPLHIRTIIKQAGINWDELQEIRLRIQKPVILKYNAKTCYLSEQGKITTRKEQLHIVTSQEIRQAMEYISSYSMYAYIEQLKQGFLTIRGGHRVDLLDTLRANLDHCVGMAANMIGVKKNIIVVAVGPFQFAMINPKITKKSGVFETAEGCLSLDGVRPCKRYKEIEVDYLDQDFNII